ncbi:MAG: NUDIX domain-containing protein [Chloroflexi bacterium]|nr:NUDIX domain-containing protein [Chloroflexota bacterium]
MSLRLGVMSAVLDRDRNILLSRRGDLNTWTLPGGRLDAGERLEHAAQREIEEETGIEARIDRALGLYYLSGWQRMNILYVAAPTGGSLREKTRETRANRYFSPGSLPQGVLGAKEALAEMRPQPRVITSTRSELLRLRLRFGLRWLGNRLSGHPEPKFPEFNVRAVAVVLGDSTRRVLTLSGPGYNPHDTAIGFRMLPRVVCAGEAPPWEQLAQWLERLSGAAMDFQWVGLWEDTDRGMFEFVFATTIHERELPSGVQWTTTRNAAFSDRDMAYVERVKPTYARDPIWTIVARDQPTDMILSMQSREGK